MSDPNPQEPESALTRIGKTEIIRHPVEASPALSEIINRSLVHIQTSKMLAAPERRAGEEQGFEIAPGVWIVMCWIPSGEFMMGTPEDEAGYDDEHPHWVTITKGFWLAKVPITQAQWEAVMGNNPSWLDKGEDFPVDWVSWIDICGNEEREGGFLGKLIQNPIQGWRFDLPTEAQWEYACRAGTVSDRYEFLDDVAWHDGNSDLRLKPVGQKKPNLWGLHDMLGNVSEWCVDWYGDYSLLPAVDPLNIEASEAKVLRGGSSSDPAIDCRAANRDCHWPELDLSKFGFRLACVQIE